MCLVLCILVVVRCVKSEVRFNFCVVIDIRSYKICVIDCVCVWINDVFIKDSYIKICVLVKICSFKCIFEVYVVIFSWFVINVL